MKRVMNMESRAKRILDVQRQLIHNSNEGIRQPKHENLLHQKLYWVKKLVKQVSFVQESSTKYPKTLKLTLNKSWLEKLQLQQ